jgi:serine O-acetyltransferase
LNQFWRAGDSLVANVRRYQKHKARGGLYAQAARKLSAAWHFVLSVITASDISLHATLGERLKLPHPNGIVVHDNAIIGDDCMIMQQVTIGQLAEEFAPVIGRQVYIGAGAKVLGKVLVGDRARIGANAVVLADVPADHTAVGIPARIISAIA